MALASATQVTPDMVLATPDTLAMLPPTLLATLVLDAMSPTLLELSMLPRGRLRLMLMPSMVPTVWAMLDSAMPDLATAMPVLAMLLLPLPLLATLAFPPLPP